jgi:hypothetical protein
MAKVLTEISNLECYHKAKVTPTNIQSVLKVNGHDVLVGSLKGTISACSQKPPPSSNIPCTTVIEKPGGTSQVLKVNGTAVLLDTADGTTNGTPKNTWSVKSSEQQVLQTD